jgi:hypothetical protein
MARLSTKFRLRDALEHVLQYIQLDTRSQSAVLTASIKQAEFMITCLNYEKFATTSRPPLGSNQPPIQREPGVKRPEHKAEDSPPSSAEVKNA